MTTVGHLTSESLKFLFQDDALFVVAKQAQIHSVMLPENGGGLSVAKLLLEAAPALAEVSSKAEDAGLVQRLDFETSGALLGAKNREIWVALRAELLSKGIAKSYLAICEGEFKDELVENFIGGASRGAAKVKVYKTKPRSNSRALPARTEFCLLKYFSELDLSLVRALAPSARRHQIRAHAAFLKHPLIGDSLYGSKRKTSELRETAPKFYLHAEKIEFKHPTKKEPVTILAPLSPDLWGNFAPS